MTHPEPYTLELYVLNAESVARGKDSIEGHLRSCAGCRALVDEMSAFYAQLDDELKKPDDPSDSPQVGALTKRDQDLTVWENRMAMAPVPDWRSPVRSLRYYIRKYPLATAGTTLAFTALAALGVFLGYRELTRDLDPSYVTLNGLTGHFEVYNRSNILLWSRFLPGVTAEIDIENLAGTPKSVVCDIDGDGSREVLTTLTLGGEPKVPGEGLHVFRGDGARQDFVFNRSVSFRGIPYDKPVEIQGGSFVVVDTSDPGNPELLVTVKNDRSPNALVRLDRRGKVLGEYWHHGQFRSVSLADLDGDGHPEVLLCGTNDVDELDSLSEPVLIVLDPRKLAGSAESALSRGYGYPQSEAELYYVRFPLTDINVRSRSGAGINRIWLSEERLIAFWGFRGPNGMTYALDFILSRGLEPIRTKYTTQFEEFYDREFASGRTRNRLDDAYLDRLTSQIRFWVGKEWKAGTVRVGNPAAARPAASALAPR